ncbi:unnamed protein product, partial [Prorocentrum cordatum]
ERSQSGRSASQASLPFLGGAGGSSGSSSPAAPAPRARAAGSPESADGVVPFGAGAGSREDSGPGSAGSDSPVSVDRVLRELDELCRE